MSLSTGLMQLLFILYLLFLSFLGFTVLYLLLFAVAGKLGMADDDRSPRPAPAAPAPGHLHRIGVLIPAYKEDAVIMESVQANLRQQYPASHFDLIVIADLMQPATLDQLTQLPIRVMEVSFPVSTVSNAISAALAQLRENEYDILVVSDADNVMAPDFLTRINDAFSRGWRVVQGHRVAKNTNTSIALLDAISEEINNHIFRKGSRALGLSSPVIGSGMAFDFTLMRTAMLNLKTIGGYDKELEMKIVRDGHTIGYLEDAYVYDEKVAVRAVFEHQRTRWIAAQVQFLRTYYPVGMSELRQGRFQTALGMLRAVVLPRVLLLGVLILTTFLTLFTGNTLLWGLPLGLLLTLCLTLLMSVPGYLRRRIGMRELMLIPGLMLSFGRAVLNMRKAFTRFMHTPHSSSAVR